MTCVLMVKATTNLVAVTPLSSHESLSAGWQRDLMFQRDLRLGFAAEREQDKRGGCDMFEMV